MISQEINFIRDKIYVINGDFPFRITYSYNIEISWYWQEVWKLYFPPGIVTKTLNKPGAYT